MPLPRTATSEFYHYVTRHRITFGAWTDKSLPICGGKGISLTRVDLAHGPPRTDRLQLLPTDQRGGHERTLCQRRCPDRLLNVLTLHWSRRHMHLLRSGALL